MQKLLNASSPVSLMSSGSTSGRNSYVFPTLAPASLLSDRKNSQGVQGDLLVMCNTVLALCNESSCSKQRQLLSSVGI